MKSIQTSTSLSFDTASTQLGMTIEKSHQEVMEEIQTLRKDISDTANIVDELVTIQQEIESNLSINQIRQYSMKNYLPKINQLAEIMQQRSIYVLSDFWVCGIVEYDNPILCFWNVEKTSCLHIFQGYCLVYQNNQEYKYDLSKGSLTRVERDPHLRWKDNLNYQNKEIEIGMILTPWNKSKVCFLINEDHVLLRYDSGDMIAIDTFGESIFINGKLITI